MQAKERLYLTEDKKELVRESDKRASFLYAVPGDEIPDDAAGRFGLKEGKLPSSGKASAADKETAAAKAEAEAKAKAEAEAKEQAEKEAKEKADKEAKSGENKGR